MFRHDLKGHESEVSVIERDDYGRILFEYKTNNFIFEQEKTAYVICQAIDSDYVYFYEDKCYVFEFDNEFTELKSNNDWDCELDYSQMSRRSNKTTFDLYISVELKLNINIFKDACSKHLNIAESKIKDCCFDDIDLDNKSLFYMVVEAEIEKKYVIIVDEEYNVFSMEITDGFELSDLAQFKSKCGWKSFYLS